MQIKHLIGLACGLALIIPATASAAAVATIEGPDTVERGASGEHWTVSCTGCGGSTLYYEWDRDNDGVVADIDKGLYRPSIWNGYTTLGSVTMKVVVRGHNWVGGSAGTAEAVATKTITVVNGAPSADFVCDPPRVETGAPVTCEVGGIGDDSGAIPATAWDVDGDGFDDGSADEITTSFASAGTKTVRLRVTDGDGASSVSEQEIDVWAPPAGQAFTMTPSAPIAGDEVAFVAPFEAGEQGDTEYERRWDFDGDGQWDSTTPGRTTTALYDEAGTFSVRMRVVAVGDPESARITVQQLVVKPVPVVEDRPKGDGGGGDKGGASAAPASSPAAAPPALAPVTRTAVKPAAKKPTAKKKAKTCKTAAKGKKAKRSRSCAAKRRKASRAKARKRR